MLIDEYLVKLGVIADVNKAAAFRGELLNIGAAATKVAGLVVAGATAIAGYFAASVGDLDRLGAMARNTETSVAFIQQLGYAATQTNSSVDDARESITRLAKVMGEAQNGIGRGAKAFEAYNLSARNADGTTKGMNQVLGDIQERMRGMNAMQQTAFLQRMGINASMRELLSLTSEEFGKLIDQANEWGVNTDEQAAAASNLHNRFKDLRFGLGQFRTLVGLSLIPTLDRMIASFKAWFRENRVLIQDGLNRLFTAVQYVGQMVINFISFLDRVIGKTIGWRNAVLLIAGAFAIWNRAMLLNPITWIVAGIAGLLLLIDDLMTYLDGGQSSLGAFWGPFLEYVNQAAVAFAPVWQGIKDLVAALEPLAQLVNMIFGDVFIAAIETVTLAFTTLVDLLTTGLAGWVALARGDLQGFTDAFRNAFNIIEALANRVFGTIGKLIDNTLGRVAAFAGTLIQGGSARDAVAAARNAVLPGNAGIASQAELEARGQALNTGGPMPAGTGSSTANALRNLPRSQGGAGATRTANNNLLTQNVTVNVQSTDPGAAARAVKTELQGTARTAVGNMGSGVVQ
ncbi:hypothetical protein AB4Y36_38020 [Paraburkholderia sp. BR10936]|uniref:hypothetical protein n=1 Tax=Paraburkholderia sp. BR10936 TaxID=3236993 RepID=UPI0034D3183B